MTELQQFKKGIEIFQEYTDEKYVFYAGHDEIGISVSPADVSEEDIGKLDELGFYPKPEYDSFIFVV